MLSLADTIKAQKRCFEANGCKGCPLQDVSVACDEMLVKTELHYLQEYEQALSEPVADDEEHLTKANEEHDKDLGALPIWWRHMVGVDGTTQYVLNTDHIRYVRYNGIESFAIMDDGTTVAGLGDQFNVRSK